MFADHRRRDDAGGAKVVTRISGGVRADNRQGTSSKAPVDHGAAMEVAARRSGRRVTAGRLHAVASLMIVQRTDRRRSLRGGASPSFAPQPFSTRAEVNMLT